MAADVQTEKEKQESRRRRKYVTKVTLYDRKERGEGTVLRPEVIGRAQSRTVTEEVDRSQAKAAE